MASTRHPPVSVNILIVEGDPLNRRFLADALQANGYSTDTAKGWREASSMTPKQPYSLVLVEPWPTGAQNPIETEKGAFFLDQMPSVPIIAITATAIENRDGKFADYFSKPVRLETLLKVVESKIGPGRSSTERR